MTPPIASPAKCPITYSCSMPLGSPRTDLCDISDGDTKGTINPETGIYTFRSVNINDYPTGTYTFELTASIGTGPTASVKSTFKLIFVYPCPDV